MFWIFRDLAKEVFDLNGTVCLEWPKPCRYWKDPHVEKFLKDNKMYKANFDGCYFGLRSCVKGSEHLYLRKPWCLATNLPEVLEGFTGLYCPGTGPDHIHDTTCGKNAKHSQGYTVEMVLKLHWCIKRHFEGPNCWWDTW